MKWFRQRQVHRIQLYGKPGCHLCEQARDILRQLQDRYQLEIQEIDIRSDPALFRRYDIRIPVVIIDEHTELDGPISRQAIVRALRQAERRL